MLKNISQLEMMVAGKIHRYLCDQDSQIEHVMEALIQFLSYAKQVKDAAVAQQAQTAIDPQNAPAEAKQEEENMAA